MPITQSRRRFLTTLSLAGAAGLVRVPPALAAEGPLETTTVRISKDLAIREAPLEIAEELLRAEGFTDVRYVDTSTDDLSAAIAQRKVDFALDFPVLFAPGIDAGKPITVLGGVHVGCFELFAGNDVRTIANLKGRTVGFEIAPAALLRLMVAQSGSIRTRTSAGSPTRRSSRWNFSQTARSMPSWGSRRSRRNCAPARPAT